MDCKTPIASRFATIDDPPTLTNGSGIPVIGAIPIVIPTLMKIWTRSATAMAPAVHAARAHRRDRLRDVVRRSAWILRGIREPGDSRALVLLEDVDVDRGPDPEDEGRRESAEAEQNCDLRPARAGDEEGRAEHR